jgi:DNA-binding NarL/FixJ family response regulator
VLAVDDAAAIDPASTSVIRFALARLGVDPIGAFVSLPAVATAWDEVVTRRLVLGPMALADLTTIVRTALDCTSEAAEACAVWAAGSPMLAIELASSLSDDERAGRSPLPAVPRATVRAVGRLQGRLDQLSDAARRALVVVAASRSGRVPVVLDALEALGEPPGGLDEAEDAGHVVIAGGTATFTHPLLRPLSYHLVAASSRRAAHRALAGALGAPRDAAERAWHLVEACVGPDDDVAAALELVAADARRRGALSESATALERAATLSVDPLTAARRRRAAAVAALDGFDFDTALRLVAVGDDEDESAWLAVEAIERRDGESAALGALGLRTAVDNDVVADLLLGAGRRADATRLAGETVSSPLSACVLAAIDQSRPLPAEPDAANAVGRRARRRWLQAAAARGVAVERPASPDELVAAAQVAASAGEAATARDLVDRALAAVPASATRLVESLAAMAARFDDVVVTTSAAAPAVLGSLTKAERRVAEAVAAGRTNKEVADHLFVSVKTVDFHLQGIYRKLAVRSRTELAVLIAPALATGAAGEVNVPGGST